MENDAALPLQKAVVAALVGDPVLTVLIAGRVYDRVAPNAIKPYVSLGPMQVFPEQAQEYDGADITFQVDGWSTEVGTVEVKKIGRAIRAALDEKDLTLDENQRLVSLDVVSTDYSVDPDGITNHAVLSFRARTEPMDPV